MTDLHQLYDERKDLERIAQDEATQSGRGHPVARERSRPTRQRARLPTVAPRHAHRPAIRSDTDANEPPNDSASNARSRTCTANSPAPTTHSTSPATNKPPTTSTRASTAKNSCDSTASDTRSTQRSSSSSPATATTRPPTSPTLGPYPTTATSAGDGTKPPAASSSTDTNTTSPTNTNRSAKHSQHDYEQRHARERLQQASRELGRSVGRESPGLEIEL